MGTHTVENSRNAPGMRKRCSSEEAHEEHMWLEDYRTEWYCRGFLANILLGLQGLMDRIDKLDREDAERVKNIDPFDGYVYSLVSRMTGEMCNMPDSSAAFWVWRQAHDTFRVIRELPGEQPVVTEWFTIDENEHGHWKKDQ